MIGTALAIAGAVLGGGSVWGLAIRIFGWFTGSASVLGGETIFGKAAGGLIDLIVWAVKGVGGYAAKWIAHSLDYISRDMKAAVTVAVLTWGAWGIGADKWAFWRSTEPPQAAVAAAPSADPAPSRTRTGRRQKAIGTELRDMVRNAMRGLP